MTNELLATRIAKDQTQDLRRAAARRRLARSAANGGTVAREHAGAARRMRAIDRVLSWVRGPGTGRRAFAEDA
jgi:hypothetical protein